MNTLNEKKKINSNTKIPITRELIKEALLKTNGNFTRAAQLIGELIEEDVSRQRFTKWVDSFNISYYPKLLKKDLTKRVLDTAIEKAIKDKDNYCIGKILDKWGHFVGFVNDHEDGSPESNELLAIALANSTEKDLIEAREKSEKRTRKSKYERLRTIDNKDDDDNIDSENEDSYED